ncbi:MAG: cupin domain-containing protein [Sandaracinaceae bacterium]
MSTLQKGRADRREALFGGQGTVQVYDLLGRARAAPFTAVLSCELDPHGKVGRHVQEEFPEIVIGVEGQGEARVDGEVHPLRSGDVVYLRLGATLAIDNLGDTPLRYLIIKAKG